MAKLSKANFYAIQWLNSQGLPVSDIAKELNLSENQVDKNIVNSNTQENSTPTNVANVPNPKNLMITQTSGKGTNTVAIMTKQASELGDELKKQHTRPKSDNGIFRPRQ